MQPNEYAVTINRIDIIYNHIVKHVVGVRAGESVEFQPKSTGCQ